MWEQYKKKPVVIEAIEFTDENKDRIFNEIPGAAADFDWRGNPIMKIPTLEGTMVAHLGDYIIRGVRGEFYPVKADIFKETYESV